MTLSSPVRARARLSVLGVKTIILIKSDRTVHNRRFQRNNLSKRERFTLERLSNNRDIIIKPADKGGARVILNTTDYLQEAKRQLDNDTYYKRIEEDCTSGHERTINQCMNGEIQHDVAKLLKPVQSRTSIFYMLLKIHKINHPGRPVISSVNSHTEKISAYVDEFLRPIAERLPSYIRDTTDFIQQISLGKTTRRMLFSNIRCFKLIYKYRY